MGNYKSILGYTTEKFQDIIQKPEESIEKIINNTVMKLVKKQVNKISFSYNKDTKKLISNYDIYNIKLLDEIQYKKYYFPKDILNNKYYEDTKDQFALELFRFVEHSVPSYSVSNTLFYMYNTKKVDFLSTFSKEFYENNKDFFKKTEYCSIYLRIDADRNRFILSIPKSKENEIMSEFEKYYLNINNDINQFNNIKNLILKNIYTTSQIPYETDYEMIYYYFNYYDYNNLNQFNIDESLAFFTFFNFIVKLCNSTFMYSNLTMYITDKNKNIDAHRNKLFLQKIHDNNGNIDRINIYHYEPHGSKYGFSFNVIKINEIYKKISHIIEKTIENKDKTSQFINKITFKTQEASCLIGPQSLSAGVDIGYCTVFSTFWYNCLLNVIDAIGLFDKKNESNYIKKNLHKKLSDVPIETWINKIDNAITHVKNNFIIIYPPHKYDLDYILKNKDYMLKEDYNYIKNIFYVSKNINNFQDYIDSLNNFISGKINIKKLTFNEFINMYIEFLNDAIMHTDKDRIVNKIKEDFYKMRTLDYYNIFVCYALEIFNLANTSVFVSENEKKFIRKAFTEHYKKISTTQHGKTVSLPSNVQIDNDYFDYVKKIYNLEAETKKYIEERQKGTFEEETSLFKKYKSEINIIDEYGRDEYDKMMKEQENEIPKDIFKKKCNIDTECYFNVNGSVNTDLGCEDEICVPKKETIGTLCSDDSECLSGYCDNTRKLRFCRKRI